MAGGQNILGKAPRVTPKKPLVIKNVSFVRNDNKAEKELLR